MKIKFIGCEILKKEWEYLKASRLGPCEYLDYELHLKPDKLREVLQETILKNQDYDRLVLGYCRCSNMLVGIYSPKTELLFPITHDCIGLFLGSTKRHLEYVNSNAGTFYLSQGFLDYEMNPYNLTLKHIKEYGEKKAKKLIKLLYGDYNRCLFIDTPGIKNKQDYEDYVAKSKAITDYFGWNLDFAKGDDNIMKALIEGRKHPELLLVKPGQIITEELFK